MSSAALFLILMTTLPCDAGKDGMAGERAATGSRASLALWRFPERDGLHCLYVMLRLKRREVDYQELVGAAAESATGAMSLRQLRDLAMSFGLDAVITKRTPADLTPSRLPLIAHLDDPIHGAGHFVIVLHCTDTNCRVVDGQDVTIRDLSMDEFRRDWSGYILESRGGSFKSACVASAGAGSCMLGVYLILRGGGARRRRIAVKRTTVVHV